MSKNENKHTGQSQERKARLDWSKWDAIFFVIIAPFVIIATLLILAPTRGLAYLSGRFNYPLDFLILCILIIWMMDTVTQIVIIFFVTAGFSLAIIGIVRLFSNWRRYTRKKRFIRTAQIAISILVITILSLALFIPIELYSPSYKPFTYGCRDRIRSKADIEAIRAWLRTLSKEDCTGKTIDIRSYSFLYKSKWPDSINWPKSLTVFNPGYVNLDLDENGHPKIRLTWGAALGHWGVEIGMEDMEIPPSDFSRHGEYRLPVEPGVYVWHEIQ